MHTRNPDVGGGFGTQMWPESQGTGGTCLQPRTKVFHVGVLCGGGCCSGAHPPSLIVSGPIVRDCTHLTPEQSLPDGTDSFVSQAPSHPADGSNGVCGVEPLFSAHVAAFAVI